jgi:hypothetical protein
LLSALIVLPCISGFNFGWFFFFSDFGSSPLVSCVHVGLELFPTCMRVYACLPLRICGEKGVSTPFSFVHPILLVILLFVFYRPLFTGLYSDLLLLFSHLDFCCGCVLIFFPHFWGTTSVDFRTLWTIRLSRSCLLNLTDYCICCELGAHVGMHSFFFVSDSVCLCVLSVLFILGYASDLTIFFLGIYWCCSLNLYTSFVCSRLFISKHFLLFYSPLSKK